MNSKRYLAVTALLIATACAAMAGVPNVISYQGKLVHDTGAPYADGTYSMTFAVYSVETGGTALWFETNPAVQVKDGLFSVMLGSVNPMQADLFATGERYFAVSVGGAELAPRQRIGSVPFARTAQTALTAQTAANGVPTGAIIMWSGSIASIPPGWALCDGTNGTPNLRDKFVVGAGGSYAPSANGPGRTILDLNHSHTSNDHTHTVGNSGNHYHHMDFYSYSSDDYSNYYWYNPDGYNDIRDNHRHRIEGNTQYEGNHNHGSTGGSSNRGMSPELLNGIDIRPPYYALAYIMKLP